MPKGTQFVDRSGKVGTQIYSTVLDSYMLEKLITQWHKIFPRPLDEDGFPVKYPGMTAQEMNYAVDHMESLAEDLADDPFVYAEEDSPSALLPFVRAINPDYQIPRVSEMVERERRSEELVKKAARYAAERTLSVYAADSEEPILKRTHQSMMDPAFSKDTILKNARRKEKLQSADPVVKREGVQEIFDEMVELSGELGKIDLTDDQSIVDNFELLSRAMHYGPELVNLLKQAEAVGIDFDTPENRELLTKMGTVAEIGYYARAKVDVMCHPAYAQVDMEQLGDKLKPFNIELPDGSTVEPEELYKDTMDGKMSKNYAKVFEQYGMQMNSLQTNPELFDKSLTPEQRIQKFQANYWNIQREIRPHPLKVEFKNGQLNEIDPEYGGFVDESELTGHEDEQAAEAFEEVVKDLDTPVFDEIMDSEEPQESEIPEEIEVEPEEAPKAFTPTDPKVATGDLIEGLPDINQYRTAPQEPVEGPKTRKEALREMFIANVKTLQTLIPGFHVDPKEIDTYISDERIRLHDQAVAVVKVQNAAKEKSPDHIIAPFIRAYFSYMDKSGTAAGERYNQEMADSINDPSAKGDAFRKQLTCDIANRLQELDPDKVGYNQPFDQQAAYVLANMDALEAGMEFQRTHRYLKGVTGLALSEEQDAHMSKVEDNAVAMGGIGRAVKELAMTDLFLTIPFDKLPPEQVGLLQQKASLFQCEDNYRSATHPDREHTMREQMAFAVSYNNYKIVAENARLHTIEKHTYKPEEFTNVTPTPAQYREKFSALLEELNRTDAFYVRNSDPYKNMVGSVKDLMKELGTVGEKPIESAQKEKLQNCLDNVWKNARAYQKHADSRGLNSRRRERRGIAERLEQTTALLRDGDMIFDVFVERHNESAARAYYADVKAKNAPATPEEQKARQQEELFNRGLQRTERIRQEIENTRRQGVMSREEQFLTDVNSGIVEAREELSDMVGREELDVEKARSLMAKVMVGNLMKNTLIDQNDGEKKLTAMTSAAAQSEAFRAATEGLNSEKINEFLTFEGEIKVLKSYQKEKNIRERNQPDPNAPIEEKDANTLKKNEQVLKKPEEKTMSFK